MKNNFKVISAGLVGILIGSLSIVGANEAIRAMQNTEIKVSLNGQVQEFKDETTGERQYPLTYNNRTYLPLRNVAQLAGLSVVYDSSTNTAFLNSKTNPVSKEERQERFKKIAEVLLDNKWVKDNLYLKESKLEGSDKEVIMTSIWFQGLNNGSVFLHVKSYCRDESGKQSGYYKEEFLVYCKNNEVKARSILFNHESDSDYHIFMSASKDGLFFKKSSFGKGIGVDTFYKINNEYELEQISMLKHIEYQNDISEKVFDDSTGDLIVDFTIVLDDFNLTGKTNFSSFNNIIRKYEYKYNITGMITTDSTELTKENIYKTLLDSEQVIQENDDYDDLDEDDYDDWHEEADYEVLGNEHLYIPNRDLKSDISDFEEESNYKEKIYSNLPRIYTIDKTINGKEYKIPQININYDYVLKTNNVLANDIEKIIEENKDEDIMVEYEYYLNKKGKEDIFSVIIYLYNLDKDFGCFVYNFVMIGGNQLSSFGVESFSGISEEQKEYLFEEIITKLEKLLPKGYNFTIDTESLFTDNNGKLHVIINLYNDIGFVNYVDSSRIDTLKYWTD